MLPKRAIGEYRISLFFIFNQKGNVKKAVQLKTVQPLKLLITNYALSITH